MVCIFEELANKRLTKLTHTVLPGVWKCLKYTTAELQAWAWAWALFRQVRNCGKSFEK